MASFVVHGGRPLKGEVSVSGSKNAALPILAATLLTDQKCVIKNVPDIEDIHTMIAVLRALGSEVKFRNHTVTIQTQRILADGLAADSSAAKLCCKMRASVLLLGPLLARAGFARLPYPGGCVLGSRPIDTHVKALAQLGVVQKAGAAEEIIFRGRPRAGEVVLPEFSVTGTENILMAAALSRGVTTIRLAAVEPHVQDLCRFLATLGVEVSGIGTHAVSVKGNPRLLSGSASGVAHRIAQHSSGAKRGISYSITPDYLEAGTLVLAAILTRGNVLVKNIVPHDLDAFWNLLREMGVHFELGKNFVRIRSQKSFNACERLQTNVFPGFPTDLQPPFVILLTQANGQSKIHETLFEGRFAYFPDLIKMGAKIEKLNPHEAVISGPSRLKGSQVKSWDIRAGAAMILAALTAQGRSVVSDIHYIDRGYERFDEKLRQLGARIERVEE